MSEIIGTVRRSDERPDCLQLYFADGTPGTTFAPWQTLADVRMLAAITGLRVADDGTVTKPDAPMNIDGHEVHPSITHDRVVEAVDRRMHSLDNPGFCLACGADAEGCEPDACGHECEACGEAAVYGADELLLRMAQP